MGTRVALAGASLAGRRLVKGRGWRCRARYRVAATSQRTRRLPAWPVPSRAPAIVHVAAIDAGGKLERVERAGAAFGARRRIDAGAVARHVAVGEAGLRRARDEPADTVFLGDQVASIEPQAQHAQAAPGAEARDRAQAQRRTTGRAQVHAAGAAEALVRRDVALVAADRGQQQRARRPHGAIRFSTTIDRMRRQRARTPSHTAR